MSKVTIENPLDSRVRITSAKRADYYVTRGLAIWTSLSAIRFLRNVADYRDRPERRSPDHATNGYDRIRMLQPIKATRNLPMVRAEIAYGIGASSSSRGGRAIARRLGAFEPERNWNE